MARRQEQEPARPDVSEVGPGVLRMQLPIRLPGLGHVNCYALPDADGVALVDPGLPGPATWRALGERLRSAGFRYRHVHTVVVTHSHPDHFGCASRLARVAGARIVAHRSFRFGPQATFDSDVSVEDLTAHRLHAHGAHANGEDTRELAAQIEVELRENDAIRTREGRAGRTPWGSPRRAFAPLWVRASWHLAHWLGRSFVPTISHPVVHGDTLVIGESEWQVLHTPGHTADHFCLHDRARRLLLAGDHLLPTITPHISGMGMSPDPLAAFFHSLDRAAALEEVAQVLPAHGHPFRDLAARAQEIKRHHRERLERVLQIGREIGPAGVPEFMQLLFKPRSWGMMAESETYAHLEHLRIAGAAERRQAPDGRLIYEAG